MDRIREVQAQGIEVCVPDRLMATELAGDMGAADGAAGNKDAPRDWVNSCANECASR